MKLRPKAANHKITSVMALGLTGKPHRYTHQIALVFLLLACYCCFHGLFLLPPLAINAEQQTDTVERDIDSFKAIKSLHSKLDVDADGEVDDLESKHFLESDQKTGSATAQKLRYLHQDGRDKSISVDELWSAWTSSEVHNWTVDETVYWLVNSVDLPDYAELFHKYSINGTLMPRLAADSQFLTYKLGITDPAAKSKISIKAMDVVLFGPPKLGSSRLRELNYVIIALALTASAIFYSRSRASQLQLQGYKEKLDSIQKADDQISELQKELERSLKAQEAVATEKKNLEHQLEMQRQYSASSLINGDTSKPNKRSVASNSNGDADNASQEQTSNQIQIEKLETQVKILRRELKDTNDSLTARKFRAPQSLRNLLKHTYDLESHYYNEKKLNLEAKATEMKLRNQKLQKKKTSFLGYYKIAQENSLEDDLNTIVEVKEAFQKMTREIKERNDRWREIEEFCNCSLDLAPIVSSLKATSRTTLDSD